MKFRDEVPAFTKLNSRKDFCNRENKISDKFQIKQRRFQISFRLHARRPRLVIYNDERKRLDVLPQTSRRFFKRPRRFFFLPWCYEVNHETALFLIENQTVCRS